MVNRHRGEVALEVGAKTHTLCLTLGALAELESQTGSTTLADLIGALSKPSAKIVAAVLTEGLKAGSGLDHAAACALLASDIPPGALVRAYNALIRATFTDAG